MQIGYKLFAEDVAPKELIRRAVEAERAGFDFVEISDHFHPWLPEHGHSSFAWAILSAIAAQTTTLRLATGVTCPSVRYHPAIVAQAAATLQIISDGRFTLGVGAGERLSERIVGQGWPEVDDRHARLREALEIIRLLWSGGTHSYRGEHLRLEDARVYDLPERLPEIVVAAGGPQAASLAAELGDGIFSTDPDASLVEAWTSAGGRGPRYAEAPTAYAPDATAGAEAAHRRFRFGALGWKVLAELPDPTAFDQATQSVRVEDMEAAFACGPDVERHVEVVTPYVEAGFDHIALMDASEDADAFMAFFADELGPRLRELGERRAPSGGA